MEDHQLRIMVYRHSVFYSPLIATIAGGFLEDEGLDTAYFQKPAERNPYDMFRQGEIDGVGSVAAAMGDAVPPVAFSSLMATREFLVTPTAEAFMRAYHRALRFVIQSPAQEIAEAESSFFPDISIPAITAAVARYQQ